MIDSHTHLDLCEPPDTELVAAAVDAGVSRIVTVGHTIKMVSENLSSVGAAIRLRIDHAAIIPITVVLPEPVAILQAKRVKARKPAALASRPGSSRGISGRPLR